MAHFDIPPQYQDLLEEVAELSSHALKSDEEVLQQLLQHAPVTSEKCVWAFWDSGIATMPAWCKRNVIDWVRICGDSWTVRVLDNVPESPNYALKFLERRDLADAFVNRTMDGPYVGQHAADLVRGPVLTRYGGVWMDVGSILVRHLDRVCWDVIQDPATPIEAAVAVEPSHGILNYFVACKKGDPFIRRWHEVFLALWEGRTNLLGIADHPLVSFVKQIPPDKLEKAENGIAADFKVPMTQVFEYAIQIVVWGRLTMLDADPADGFSCSDYWLNKILWMDAIQEAWRAEMLLGFNVGGQSLLDILTTRLDIDKDSKEYRLADKVVWQILTQGSMQKIFRGGNILASVQLGTMLDMPENAGKDRGQGTFAELLRYGTLHWRQKRPALVSITPVAKQPLIKKGHLEPF
ncbi:uncharacterized protein B0I36DRAFT_277212 [Microdochium trichocladiopsis]|uniref:Capsule polysaccharide biosynthesis protein n=1 Tax=Microdochium trichocladiopsis TaxID=1682393 RepID=A0A9P9BKJ0_9PEZI|nr:uncharacterized protein B0I36DRAFT_277212 [Microdochium trichocladiopsis]KAH7018571.1 hypothetical protein B0I36DRAFT_277212 [Microdochium trichocladiopsis]